jgi:uncharacterized integral membrane protein (TIGR00698 family)
MKHPVGEAIETNKKSEKKWFHIIPGIIVCFIIATVAWCLGTAFPIIGGPVIAILMGILITTLFPKLVSQRFHPHIRLEDGVKYTSKKLLQYSIVLLGFSMNLYNVIKVGSQSLYVMIFTLSAAFIVAFVMGKVLKLSGNTATLIGVGTSICGGSAIAATAPVIGARDEDVSQAISTIFLFNIIAVLIFPALGHFMGMGDMSFGMWAGTAINDTSSVVAAGTSWSNAAGNNAALEFATIVKLTRTLMIVPITLFLAVYTARKREHAGAGDFKFAKVFPWFVLFFILAAVVNTFAGLPGWVSNDLSTLGKFMIVMAMSAIGLNTNIKKLLSNGIKPIFLGLCCWFAVAAVSVVVQKIMGI